MAAHPLIVLWLRARLTWHEASGVESMIDTPVHLSRAHVWRNSRR